MNALQENTPAILWLYTQDLKSFVSRISGKRIKGIYTAIGWSVWMSCLVRQWQNARLNKAKCRMHDGHSCRLHESKNP
ncbi:hypothetical protein FQ186_04910 [Pseudomonas sp. ANT_H14]|uniref:hypothetical protein n=1 Tax=unclassified Pseudomonas TaxID=196821 RepID=UPI0011EE155D|nr:MULTISPECIES: hypothetical protein [unclassified Pseudomonas]KAA0947463.1 hypothetical protein FQ182_10425 [Pseudomonas sp. ANT_H4]KAA0953881.1 hypothetical protein FQ186_04910 [Pseudomonas sp. ANT_H14]